MVRKLSRQVTIKKKKPDDLDSQAFFMVRISYQDFFTFQKISICWYCWFELHQGSSISDQTFFVLIE